MADYEVHILTKLQKDLIANTRVYSDIFARLLTVSPTSSVLKEDNTLEVRYSGTFLEAWETLTKLQREVQDKIINDYKRRYPFIRWES